MGGARVLSALANKDQFAEETLRAIGTMRDVVERLIEILNWRNYHKQEIRRAAAEIISKLVKKNQNRIRVMAIAGSMESIASLLYDNKQIEIHSRQYGNAYDYSVFSLLGLKILKNLANKHDNCAKIGSSRGLLPKIIGLTKLNPNAPESQIKTTKLALQLMGMLAGSTGSTGKALRKGISEIVFATSNLRDVIHYREVTKHHLQILSIDILTTLSGLHNLNILFLSQNNFSGSFPGSIAGLHRLNTIIGIECNLWDGLIGVDTVKILLKDKMGCLCLLILC